MKKKNKNRRIKILPGTVLYVLLVLFAIVFTQLLRNSASTALLLFVLILPVFSVIHCLIGRSAIQIYVMSEKQRTEKNEPFDYEIRIVNSSFLSFPFIETVLSEPATDSVRCATRKFVLSLVPFGSYNVNNTVRFKYRGLYEIGVKSLYISDLFRFIAIRADMDNYTAISVYPRRMSINDSRPKSTTDVPSPNLRKDIMSERNELADIRDYVPGDSVRDIHWKLSSKTQDIKVKQYSNIENKHVYIMCDLSAAAEPPKKRDTGEIYKSLKKLIAADREKEKKKKLINAVKLNSYMEDENREKPARKNKIKKQKNGSLKIKGEGLLEYFKRKRRNAKFRRNLKSGMNEKDAETIRSIDELIASGERRRRREPELQQEVEKESIAENGSPRGVSETTSDLERIISAVSIDDEISSEVSDISFGGRVREDESEEYDEFCTDAVVEMTIAEALTDLRSGSVCTVVWFDRRSDSGLYSLTMRSDTEIDLLVNKLAGATIVPHGEYVSELTAAVAESSDVSLKIVTSNIDPQSISEINSIPAKFGGAGTGCSAEVILFSPIQKYEDPALRSAYTVETCAGFTRRGMNPVLLREGKDGSGNPVFVSAM